MLRKEVGAGVPEVQREGVEEVEVGVVAEAKRLE
jgi:hypothetical protein